MRVIRCCIASAVLCGDERRRGKWLLPDERRRGKCLLLNERRRGKWLLLCNILWRR
jgi:hypothetical protein